VAVVPGVPAELHDQGAVRVQVAEPTADVAQKQRARTPCVERSDHHGLSLAVVDIQPHRAPALHGDGSAVRLLSSAGRRTAGVGIKLGGPRAKGSRAVAPKSKATHEALSRRPPGLCEALAAPFCVRWSCLVSALLAVRPHQKLIEDGLGRSASSRNPPPSSGRDRAS
jgi:hypothetical protein